MHNRLLNRIVKAVDPVEAKLQQEVNRGRGRDETDACMCKEGGENYSNMYSCRPPPIFMPLITFFQVSLFISCAVSISHDVGPINGMRALFCSPSQSQFLYDPYKRHQAWRFLTYMFVHIGCGHLVLNCLVQLFLGVLLELVYKWWKVGLIYFSGVIAGSLAHSVTDPFIFLAGASGGCYALVGAHSATIILYWDIMNGHCLHHPLDFMLSGVVRLVIFTALISGDIISVIWEGVKGSAGHQVGFSAHLGGFIAGLLLGMPVFLRSKRKPWQDIGSKICVGLYVCFIVGAILFNAVCGHYGICPSSRP